MGVGCVQWFTVVTVSFKFSVSDGFTVMTMSFSVSHGGRVCAVVHDGDHVLQCESWV